MSLPKELREDFTPVSEVAKDMHTTPRTLLGLLAKHRLVVIRLGWKVLVPHATVVEAKRIYTTEYLPKKRKPKPDIRSDNLSFDF